MEELLREAADFFYFYYSFFFDYKFSSSYFSSGPGLRKPFFMSSFRNISILFLLPGPFFVCFVLKFSGESNSIGVNTLGEGITELFYVLKPATNVLFFKKLTSLYLLRIETYSNRFDWCLSVLTVIFY